MDTNIKEIQEPRGINLSAKEEKALLGKVQRIILRREKEEEEKRRKELEQLYGANLHA